MCVLGSACDVCRYAGPGSVVMVCIYAAWPCGDVVVVVVVAWRAALKVAIIVVLGN